MTDLPGKPEKIIPRGPDVPASEGSSGSEYRPPEPLSGVAKPSAQNHGVKSLPEGATPLVGRDGDVDGLIELMDRPNVRLVTLTGPGGIGKTRLALAAGRMLCDRLSLRTAFVTLEEVTRPEEVLAEIGRGLKIELGTAASPLEALLEYLQDDAWLLILDNLEQVVEAASSIESLLARIDTLVVLATSRTALGLRAEWEYAVGPLPVPNPDSTTLDDIRSAPAVALFVELAQEVRHDFALTEENAASVASICRRLDGLPLAIELAAARIRTLDPDPLLQRLEHSLDALGSGMVDMPERQRTLRARRSSGASGCWTTPRDRCSRSRRPLLTAGPSRASLWSPE